MVRATEQSGENGIKVEVAVLGGELKVLFVAQGSTRDEVLTAAGMDTNCTVKCNGAEVGPEDVVEEGDRLIIAKNVKGGC